jgi:hypothetical protein
MPNDLSDTDHDDPEPANNTIEEERKHSQYLNNFHKIIGTISERDDEQE